MSVVDRCPACGFTPETRDRATIWRDIARAMIEARQRDPRWYGLSTALISVRVQPPMWASFAREWNDTEPWNKLDTSQDVRGLYAMFLAHFAETES